MKGSGEARAAIEQHNRNICGWYAAGNYDAVAEVFAEDCWQMPPHAAPLVGREALRAFWKQALTWGKWEFALTTHDVVTSGGIAVERGSYTLRITARPGAPPGFVSQEDRGNYVVLWRLEADGQWRAVWDAPVSTIALPGKG